MNENISHIRDRLFDEMELALTTSCVLFAKIQPDQWDVRPHENMRSLSELTQHLAIVPAMELAILQERPMEETRKIAVSAVHLRDADSLSEVMRSGVQALTRYMASLDEGDFLYKGTAPFFAKNHPVTQVKWLIEITTHLYHHRGQLYTYMKQFGLPVSMRDLYGPAADSWTL
ncbi:DinB family protein [Paenibacillus hamazuiensis]|uniref:DinB family protein n=1 Tax=Paenibacillus hamazuiensis TaxID=2936508 RepID=UPI00200C3754|nr:DinB family protein [Paenibacillus hamazuiensis]